MESKPPFTSVFSTKAAKELTAAWEWYEDRATGLGDRFMAEVIDRLRKIERQPDSFPKRYKRYRESTVPVFPYLLIYSVDKRKRSIQVISIFHTSLNPKKKFK